MIKEIYIRDLGVIREARLSFTAGLNVLSGETGAGKTMVLTALGLLLGGRADAAAVRAGSSALLVEGRWSSVPTEVKQRIEEAGSSLDEGELLANRSVSIEGKSRAAVGGVSIPIGLLGELGEQLVVVHGQADQLRLKSASAQREALDSFASLGSLLADYSQHFQAWQQANKNLTDVLNNKEANAREVAELLDDLKAIEAVSPRAGEDLELRDLSARMSNLEALRSAAASAHDALSSDSDQVDVQALLAAARRSLENQRALDSSLETIAEKLSEASFQVAEVALELSSYVSSLEADSELPLDEVQRRLADLNALNRRFGGTLDDVFAHSEFASKRVLELDDSEDRVAALKLQIDSEREALEALAEQLSAKRTAAATTLASEVNVELAGLAMAGAELVVEVIQGEEFGPHGRDQVTILLRSYPGAEPRPIAKGASGGELSRIMLAIEVVLAKGVERPTFIFDEVDAGVGGAAAIEVGRRLARLSKQAQVIVITHLAQVAAFADNHQRVLKTQTGDITESDVSALVGQDREAELARMLSGLADSSTARQHAAELMSLAKA
ncbi:MAG: DNA repair protein RecN [Actinobacteria bacterium]|uniref:DNA repair protein RecN n=1 Tax=freshwater metagenome TaxID=449393 RepID=A0A6J6NCK5_9ZZZZ|nr:DNA repair protein RecN [Actinomycetota bacterium]